MRNTELFKIAKVFDDIIEKDEVVCDIFDKIADNLIEDEEVKNWFYNQAGIIKPENYDENSIS
jgi:uncharacterized protein YabN with tetrapyrrole methylase and pyrophosphatase domain